jgi:hypothetical protein
MTAIYYAIVFIYILNALKFIATRENIGWTDLFAVLGMTIMGMIPYFNFCLLVFMTYIHIAYKEKKEV